MISCIACLLILMAGCEKEQTEKIQAAKYQGKKILVVHSYHKELYGVIQKTEGLVHVLENENVDYKIIYMDTKRHTSDEFMKKSALMAKDTIENYKPDVVITFDDNAFKYLIMPYYKNSDLPVVFAGIDWDASVYGAPYSNATGMISISLISQAIESIKKYANGKRIAWLGYDAITTRKKIKAYHDILGLNMSVYYVKNLKAWQNAFIKLQSETDILIHSDSLTTMQDWDEQEAAKFVLNYIKIPVVTVDKSIMCCSILGILKIQSEYGEWAAKTALEIINGKTPKSIPLAHNKEGKILLNLVLAEKLDIAFDAKFLKNAEIYQQVK